MLNKRYLMYETNSKGKYVDYGEVVQIINDKMINVNMGGQRDESGNLVIIEAVSISGDYVPRIGDWVGIEWRNGQPIAIGGNSSSSTGLLNINNAVKIVSTTDMANGVVNSDHIRTNTIEARHIVASTINASHISAGAITTGHISAGTIVTSSISANAITSSLIAADQITTAHVQAQAITASRIAADAITSTHISANSITSLHISAGAINATDIAAGAVNANHITANAIAAGHISAGAISSTHISAGAVTATHIAAGAIASQHISAGAINAGHISANSIGADHLSVSGRVRGLMGQYFTNTGGTNKFEVFKGSVVEGPIDFDWGSGTPSIVGQNDNFAIRWQGFIFAPYSGQYNFYTTSSDGARLWVNNSLIIDSWVNQSGNSANFASMTLTANNWYLIRLDFYEATGNAKIKLEWQTPADSGPVVIPANYLAQANTVIDGGTIITNSITSSQIKVGTITAESGIIADATIQTAHIASGSITSAHISNASILTAHIASGSITNAKIANASITDAKIVNLSAEKLDSGYISSDRIQANTITGEHISANSISSDHIIGGTIDASKLLAHSITATQIAAQTITSNEIQVGAVTAEKIRAASITADHIATRGLDANNITVYNSITGETLVGGGYLRVGGLDVGVVQSDNLVANGLFLNSSSQYGLKRNNPSGQSILGAATSAIGAHKIWKIDLSTNSYTGISIDVTGKKPVDIAIDENDAFAYVTVEGNDTVIQIDLENNVVTNTLSAYGIGPNRIKYEGVALEDHKHLIFLNADSHDHNIPDTIGIIDSPGETSTSLYVHHVIPVGNGPYDFVIDDNRLMYITQSGQGDILVINMHEHDSTTWKVAGAIPIAAFATDNYHGGLPSSIGLNGITGGDSAGQYDNLSSSSTQESSGHNHGGYGSSDGSLKKYTPKGIALSTDSEHLYVVDSENNELLVVDKFGKAPYNGLTGSHSHTQNPDESLDLGMTDGGGPVTKWVRYRIPIGDKPNFVRVVSGKIFVTLDGSGQLAILDEQDILDEIALDRAFYTPDWNPFMPMRTKPTFTPRTLTVGAKPSHMVVRGTTLIVSLNGQNQISLINTITESISSTINTGASPLGMAITSDGNTLYVANNGSSGVLSYIYPTGKFFGDAYIGLEGGVEHQGADSWIPDRSEWIYNASGNVIASATVEFRINEPFLNEGGYAKLSATSVTGNNFQYSMIEQDIYNVTNYSNGSNLIDITGERLDGNFSGTVFYPKNEWLNSPAPSNIKIAGYTSGGTVSRVSANPSTYTIYYGSSARIEFSGGAVPSGNWVEANYTARNNIHFRDHNGSVMLAVENSSSPNFNTHFQIDEYVPKFVVYDNKQTDSFTPTADGISQTYTGLEYSTQTDRSIGKSVTSSVTPSSGSVSYLTVENSLIPTSKHGDTTGDAIPSVSDLVLPSGLRSVTVDLGAKYMVGMVAVSHKYGSSRIYHDTKTEVSEDGTTWITIYDSAISGEYSELPSYHPVHDHTHYAKTITFNAKPVRYIRDWANGWTSVDGLTSGSTNNWNFVRAYGDWKVETGYVYPSNSEKAGQQIATNGSSIVTTDITDATVSFDIPIEFTSWWYMTYLIGPDFGTMEIQMPTLMNSGHFLHCYNSDFTNKIAHRHVMPFTPSSNIDDDSTQSIKAGKHRVIIRRESGKISLDRIRVEDYQYYSRNDMAIPSQSASSNFRPYRLAAEQAKWYVGQGRQATEGAYDEPRRNPDTGLPDGSVPIKYRFRVKAELSPDNTGEERGIAYVTSCVMETGKQRSFWRDSAASDKVPSSKLPVWDGSQPHKTGIQSHHLANGAVRGAKILAGAIMDWHVSPYAKIQEFKLGLNYPTHGHGRYTTLVGAGPFGTDVHVWTDNKDVLDTITGWAGSGGVYGTDNTLARGNHYHANATSGNDGFMTASDFAKLSGIQSGSINQSTADGRYVRSGTDGSISGKLKANAFYVYGAATDLVNNAPMNGIGYTNATGGVGGAVQLGGHYGINLKTSGNTLLISPNTGLPPLYNNYVMWHSGNFVPSNYSLTTHTHSAASASNDGFMTSGNWIKLNEIEAGAISQTTADGRYLRLTGGTLSGGSLVVVSNGDTLKLVGVNHTYMEYHPAGAGRKAYVGFPGSGSTTFTIANESTGGNVAINTSGNLMVNNNVVWHSGNFIPSNYYNKTETNNLIASAGNIRAEQANTFTYAGTAITIQPSANVAANTKLLKVNNSSAVELFSIDNEGDVVIKANLTVQGTTQYAGTTTVDGDYTITQNFNVSGNSVLGNDSSDTTTVTGSLVIPSGSLIKEIGKEVEVMRFPVYGIAGDLQFQTDSTTWESVTRHYWTFNNGDANRSCLPAVPTGATRKFRLLISYSGATGASSPSLRVVQDGTTTAITTVTIPSLSGDLTGPVQTLLSPSFTTSHTSHTDFQVMLNAAGSLVIKYIAVIAYDVY